MIKEIKLSHSQKFFENKFNEYNKQATNSERLSFIVQGMPPIIIDSWV